MDSLKFFFKLFFHRIQENRLNVYAGALTYNTLLSIVPIIVVVFSIFTYFPLFDEATEQLKAFIYENFAPSAGDFVQEYIELFVNNAKKMGIVSMLGLVVVAVMLISSIDQALNEMWILTKPRKILPSFGMYLGVLLVTPLFMGASIAVSSYIFSLELFSETGIFSFGHKLLKLVPFGLTWLLFTLIYMIVPNTHVNFKYATLGALFTGIFFTLGKQAFIWYITTFPSYQAIYGALATIPIMFVWVQLSWKVALFGGQFAAVLQERAMINRGELPDPFINKE